MIDHTIRALLAACVLSLGVTVRAEAGYLDPGVGGMLFQFLAMIFAAITGFVLLFARRIRIGISRARRWFRELRNARQSREEAA